MSSGCPPWDDGGLRVAVSIKKLIAYQNLFFFYLGLLRDTSIFAAAAAAAGASAFGGRRGGNGGREAPAAAAAAAKIEKKGRWRSKIGSAAGGLKKNRTSVNARNTSENERKAFEGV